MIKSSLAFLGVRNLVFLSLCLSLFFFLLLCPISSLCCFRSFSVLRCFLGFGLGLAEENMCQSNKAIHCFAGFSRFLPISFLSFRCERATHRTGSPTVEALHSLPPSPRAIVISFGQSKTPKSIQTYKHPKTIQNI